MTALKRFSACISIGLAFLTLQVCTQASEDGGYYLDPAKYVGTWALEDGTKLEKLILNEDTWMYVKGDNILGDFTWYQGGKGKFSITATAINLDLEAIYACPTVETCGWYNKGTPEYFDRVGAASRQESVSYSIMDDTTLAVDLGSGPQVFTKQ